MCAHDRVTDACPMCTGGESPCEWLAVQDTGVDKGEGRVVLGQAGSTVVERKKVMERNVKASDELTFQTITGSVT